MYRIKHFTGALFLLLLIYACSTTKNYSGKPGFKVVNVVDDKSFPDGTGKIVGVVKDAKTGERVSKGSIFIYSLNQSFPLNQDGSFSHEIPAGKHVFSFDGEGYDLITTSNILIRTKTFTYVNVELLSSTSRRGPTTTKND